MNDLIKGFLTLSNRDLWLTFVGVGIPLVVAFVNNAAWPPMLKFTTFVVTSIVAALGFIWAYDAFVYDDLPRLFLLLALIAMVVYQVLKKPMQHAEVLTDILLHRSPAIDLPPPVTKIEEGTTVQVTPNP